MKKLVTLALVCAALGGCRREGPERETAPVRVASGHAAGPTVEAGAAKGFNLLLLTLDTTRADRLGCYGYAAAETPNLDRLAVLGVRFAQAVSPAPMTLPAHASLLTGLYPPGNGVRTNGDFRLAAEQTTLAEILAGAGYETAAFVSSFVLDPRFGLDQGFARYDARVEAARGDAFLEGNERPAGATTDAALAWLARRDAERPFLAWVHYFDPHADYAPPEPFAARFPGRPYDGEIAYMDAEVGRLLTKIETAGLARSTLVVVAGDHGESLGEHGERYHSRTIYEGAVRVPLIFAAPGVLPEGQVVDGAVVSLVDVVPTVLSMLGLEPPPTTSGKNTSSTAGESAATGEHGEPPERPSAEPQRVGLDLFGPGKVPAERAVYLETLSTYLDNGWAPLFGMRSAAVKVIRAPRPEAYDLLADPAEARNLWPGPPLAQALATRLDDWLAHWPPYEETAAAALPVDAEARRRLEALGYVSSSSLERSRDLPDPKDMLPSFEELSLARDLARRGGSEEALRRVEAVVRRFPDDPSALHQYGELLAVAGRPVEAEPALRRSMSLRPNARVAALLAQVLMALRRFDDAEALLAEAAALDPFLGALWIAKGDLLVFHGRLTEALPLYEKAAAVDPYRAAGIAASRRAAIERELAARSRS